jgi:hypothetical protein
MHKYRNYAMKNGLQFCFHHTFLKHKISGLFEEKKSGQAMYVDFIIIAS